MHGLKTINQLNELAAQNANAKSTLEKAEQKLKENGSPLSAALSDVLTARETQRRQAIEKLKAKSVPELLDYVGALGAPTTLEVALAAKLFELTKGETKDGN